MWKELQKGWEPPKEITRNYYNEYRSKYNNRCEEDMHLIGYIGFAGSFGGRFYDGGYATNKGKQNYHLQSYNNIMRQLPNILGIDFRCSTYENLEIPPNSIIYCDPPYEGTKKYSNSGAFDHTSFWQWCRVIKDKGHTIYISEYNAPKDFITVWEKPVKCTLGINTKTSVEKLYTI